MLALAFGPLERSDLLNLLRSVSPDVTGDDLDQALSALARFIARDDLRSAYVLAHPRFGAYRLTRLKADGDYDRYERAFLEWGRLLAAPSPANRPASQSSRCIVQYYSAHLDRAEARPEDFLELLSPDWRASAPDGRTMQTNSEASPLYLMPCNVACPGSIASRSGKTAMRSSPGSS